MVVVVVIVGVVVSLVVAFFVFVVLADVVWAVDIGNIDVASGGGVPSLLGSLEFWPEYGTTVVVVAVTLQASLSHGMAGQLHLGQTSFF